MPDLETISSFFNKVRRFFNKLLDILYVVVLVGLFLLVLFLIAATGV